MPMLVRVGQGFLACTKPGRREGSREGGADNSNFKHILFTMDTIFLLDNFLINILNLLTTVETGYKVTAYKVKSVIKSLYHSPNMPLKSKFRPVIT